MNCTLVNFSLSGTSSNWVSSSINYPYCGPNASCFNLTDIQIVNDRWPYDHPATLSYLATWYATLTVHGITASGNVNIPSTSVNWLITDTTKATINANGKLKAKAPGTTYLIATVGTHVDSVTLIINAPVLPPVIGAIDPYLANPNSSSYQKLMPVVIIRYLPTADGINLDVAHAPDFWSLGNITLAAMETNLNTLDKRIKFLVEEGTKFRDYSQQTKQPYLGYKVVQYITVYEPTPRGKVAYMDTNGFPVYEIDYHSIFERFNVQNYVNNQGVKEVWVWSYGHDSGVPSYNSSIHHPCNFRHWWESNMSSPTTGDISNSNMDNSDLPIFNKTYVVYNQNIRRSQAEAVHNRGHQFERMFTYIETGNTGGLGTSPIFWQSFAGFTPSGTAITGRCGWTHMPPNTTVDYDYTNPTIVLSDIKDWRYDNTGVKLPTNQDTWANLNYVWLGSQTFGQKTESQFYIFWMQSFPGFNNNIPYSGNNVMSNWWQIYSDWDFAVNAGMELYEAICTLPTINSTVLTQPSCTVSTGSILINASGSGILEYSVNNGTNWQTSNTFSGLAPGIYPIKVKMQGNVNCNTTGASVTINPVPTAPTINGVTVTQPTCAIPSGMVVIAATGSGMLEYSVNNGSTWQTSNTFSSLAPGNYPVRVRLQASSNCNTLGSSVIINAVPTAPVINSTTVTQPTCAVLNGTIVVNATGSGTLEYSVNNGSAWQTSNTFSSLAPGNYPVKVRLLLNPTCIATGNTIIINSLPTAPVFDGTTVTQPTCAVLNGTIVVNAIGNGTLEYSVNNGGTWQTSNTFSSLAPGNYPVKVRLLLNPTCIATGNTVIIDPLPTAPAIDGTTVTQPTCSDTTGIIVANATGGGQLEYSIDSGMNYQTSNIFPNLQAGNYHLIIRLQNDPTCTTTYSQNPIVLIAATGCCPSNIAVNGLPIPNGTYAATIEITSAGTIPANGNVLFKAGMSVELQANFEVLLGGVFEILMHACQ